MAQHTLTVQVVKQPHSHLDEPIYLTGNFNGWDPAAKDMHLRQLADGSLGISIVLDDVPGDRIEFKFTRGDWLRSECTTAGHLTGPRISGLHGDTSIRCVIEGWRDDFPVSTASPNVHILDSAFYIPQLDRYRKIWIYLPEDYQTSQSRYPVIYMQDGQHLFDEATSQGRIGPIEWGVDETIDRAAHKSIVVAINHQDDYRDREPEFYFHPNAQYPEVEGPAYLAFIAETLKPYIDKHFRTLAGKEHTAIAGSSLGGLISFYAGLHYPDTFGLLGIFSPSIWMDERNLENDLRQLANAPISKRKSEIAGQKYYFYAGSQENRRKVDGTFVRMEKDVTLATELLRPLNPSDLTLTTDPFGRHGALYWREAFPAFYEWFSQHTIQRLK